MNRDFVGALLQLNAEKNIPREQLVATLAEAIQSAYRRATPNNEDVFVEVDPDSGRFNAFRARYVVDEVEDPLTEFGVDEAKKVDAGAKVGDLVTTEQLDPSSFGRIHAQMATQLVRQRLREVEREQVFGQYAQRESEIITGTVSRVEPRGVILDVGRAEAILPTTDQSATEHYRIGQHVKAFVLEVRRTTKGPLIYVSRTHKNFLRRLFELEVPEINAGTVEIKAIAREAGSRSKVAVASRQEGLDPVGATVGQRGGRVQAVVAELGGEKIDIIPWNEDPAIFVANALSPAQVVKVEIDETNRIAAVTVPERMLSLAIGREGQNARLAAKLTGWRIDIRSDQAQVRPAAPVEPELSAVDDVAVAEAVTAGDSAAAETGAAATETADVAPKKRATRKTPVKSDVDVTVPVEAAAVEAAAATKASANGTKAAKVPVAKSSTASAATNAKAAKTPAAKTPAATAPAAKVAKAGAKTAAKEPAAAKSAKAPAKASKAATEVVAEEPAPKSKAPTAAPASRSRKAVAVVAEGGE